MTSSTPGIPTPAARPKPSFEELKLIEQRLLDELAAAQREYNASKEACKKLNPLVDDLAANHAEGFYGPRGTVRAEQSSLARYAKAIKAFNDFVLRGILPACD